MAVIRAHSIISPLGETSEANYVSVRQGRTAIRRYEGLWDIPTPFAASLFPDERDFVGLCCQALNDAVRGTDIDLRDPRLLLILSSTKGEIEPPLGDTARRLQLSVGNPNTPLCVCNACISGVDAQIESLRYLEAGLFDRVAVVGADIQCKFIVSGFQSFQVVSDEACRPFDAERVGLNPGSAVACIIYERDGLSAGDYWHTDVRHSAICNDAYHVSNPSKTAEGSYRAICSALQGLSADRVGVICAHGTATLFNDEMESVAIHRAGLQDVPVCGLKGYYGHTMGASGVLEVILTLRALEDGIILGTRGYCEQGTSQALNISAEQRHTNRKTALKMISGFGGANAAMLFWRDGENIDSLDSLDSLDRLDSLDHPASLTTPHRISRSPLSKQLLAHAPKEAPDCIVLFSRLGSWDTDQQFLQSIRQDNYYPSPALFTYTLPNIVTGELAIHYGRQIETSLILLPEHDEKLINRHVELLLREHRSVLYGWMESGELCLKFKV